MSRTSVSPSAARGPEHERGGGANIEPIDNGATQGAWTLDDGGGAGGHDLRAHLAEFADILQPAFKHALVHHADAVGLREQGGHQRLQVGRQAGVGHGLDVRRSERCGGSNENVTALLFDFDADFRELEEQCVHMAWFAIADRDGAAADRRGERKGPGFDAVGNDREVRAVEFVDTVDLDGVRPRAMDVRAHLAKHRGEADHFGLGGGVNDAGMTIGAGGGEEQIFGAEDAGILEHDARAAQLGGGRDVAAVFHAHVGAQFAEAAQVNVERALADRVSARHGADGATVAGEHRAHDQEGGALIGHEMVGGRVGEVVLGVNGGGMGVGIDIDGDSEAAEDFGEDGDIDDAGNVVNDAGLAREHGGGHGGHRRVLRAADHDLTL